MFNKLNNDVLLGDLSFSCIGSTALAIVLTVDIGVTLTHFVTVTSTTDVVPPVTVVPLLCSLVVVVPLVRD